MTPIRLCLFGLNVDEANKKLEEIYNVWLTNIPTGNQDKRVIKTTKSMYLFASPFFYHIEIELQVSSLGQLPIYVAIRVFSSERCLLRTCQQLFNDPMDLLLRWEYDPYALCYNGEHVYMLPRCARAIETGFTTFTTRLCWGENLAYCPSRVLSLMYLARRGFGLRILPSYMRCLVEGNPETKNDTSIQKPQPCISQPCLDHGSLHKRSELGVNVATLQHDPSGSRTLKRYALLGRRTLPTVLRHIRGIGTCFNERWCQSLALESFSWLTKLDATWDFHLSQLANYGLYGDRISEPILNYQCSYQGRDYEKIVDDIDHCNQSLFGDLQITICQRLQIPLQRFGCK